MITMGMITGEIQTSNILSQRLSHENEKMGSIIRYFQAGFDFSKATGDESNHD